MRKKILLAGASGLVGGELLKLLSSDRSVRDIDIISTWMTQRGAVLDGITYVNSGDLTDAQNWKRLIKNWEPDEIVLIANIRCYPHLEEACMTLEYRPSRLIVVGTAGVYSRYAEYSSIYKQIEASIRSSGIKYLILQPTMIYGSSEDKNMHKAIYFITRWKFYPIFGNGKGKFQPIHYHDVAYAIFKSIQLEKLTGTISIGGSSRIMYKDMIREIFEQLSIQPRILYIPKSIAIGVVRTLRVFVGPLLPITIEQIKRIQEDKSVSIEDMINLLNINPISFKQGLYKQIRKMGKSNGVDL